MITSIRYRGFSFYYKDNDNKYKEIFDEILAYNFKTVKVLRNIDDTKVSLIDTKYGRYVFKVFAPKTKRNERFLKSFVKGDYYQNLIVETDRVRSAGLTFPNDFYFLAERKIFNYASVFIMLIDEVKPVNVEAVRELAASGVMLTSDENVVRVEMNVQYRVTNPEKYLYSVTSPDDSLRQATDSALRGVIGKYTMDRILTEGRTVIRSDTQRELEETIRPYDMGITLLDVNFQAARPPEEVKAAFDDAIAARENEQQYIREAEAYTNEVQPRANGQAQRILEEARAYKAQTILEAQGEVARFAKLLPEYKAAPEITRERLYIETMEKVLGNTRKVLVNDKGGNLMVLPLDQMLKGGNAPAAKSDNGASNLLRLPPASSSTTSGASNTSSTSQGDIMDQRRANAQRNDYQRQGE